MKIPIKYIINSCLVHLLGISLYIFFTSSYKYDPVHVVIILSPFLIILNYFMQLNFVFKKKNNFIIIVKYTSLTVSQYFFNIFFLNIFVHKLNYNHIISQFILIFLLFISNFYLSKTFVYASK
jgi:putative flippase GtrA